MADMNFTVDANTNPAIRNLDRLNKKVEGLNQTFDGLRSALAGLAIGAAINNAVRYADAVQDVSNATGVATANVLGFSQAVFLSGGDSEKAQQSLLKFVQTIGEAAEGSKTAQSAFQQVGVSLTDLRTLSEQDLLQKTITGLAGITDASQRLKLAQELLGKAARGIDWNNVANSYGKATQEATKYAESVRKASELQDRLDRVITRVNLAVLKAIEPIASFVEKLNDEQINKFVDSLVKLAGIATAIIALSKALEILGKSILYVAGMAALLKPGVLSLGITFSAIATRFRGFAKDIKSGTSVLEALRTTINVHTTKTLPHLAKGIGMVARGFLAWAGVIMIVNDAVDLLTGKSLVGWIKEAGDSLERFVAEKFPGVAKAMNKLGAMMGMAPGVTEPAGAKVDPSEDQAEMKKLMRQQQQAQSLRDVKDANDKLRQSILDITKAYSDRNDEFQKGLQDQLKFMSMSEEQIALQQALDEIEKRAADTVAELVKQKQNLADSEKALIPLIDAEIAKVKASVDVQQQAATATLAAIEQRRLAQEKLNLELEKTRTAAQNSESLFQLQEQLNLVGQFGDKLQDNLIKLDVERELRGKLIELGIKQIELENNRAKLGEQRFQQEMAQLEALRQAALGYANARLAAENKVIEATRKAERTDVAGAVAKRMEEIQRSIDPTVLAVQKVDSLFGNMGRAIDDFVQTGKFKFKDFAASIIRDLIAIELKAQATKFLSSVLGTAGSFFGSLLGFANGGNPPVNKPSIVGERGPELFVPKTAGTIIPNNQLGKGNQLGAGQISAPVTNNYITNNISALDAKSVAQLFAENRKTLLGSVKMAEKELPYRLA